MPSLAALERRLERGEPGVVRAPWTATGDAFAPEVQGEVVWSAPDQAGYLVFHAFAPNDPRERQYQLWIFDEARPSETPVDGGVFDVGPSGEAVVAIDAKLPVAKPTLFAVTVEPPGGVVVSRREHILVTAAVN